LNALGVAYNNLGKYSSATTVLNKAIEIDSRDGDSYYRLAEAYNNLGKYNDALTASNEAIQYLKKNMQAHAQIEKGKAYEGLGDLANAVASYQEAGKDKRFTNWVNWKIDVLKKQSQ
jgi:tetratricopeptide (TPR) repeat protein